MTSPGRAILAIAATVTMAGGLAGEEAGPPAPHAPHAAAEAAPPSEDPGVRLSWKKGKTVLDTPGLHLELQNRMQMRWTGDWPEDDDQPDTGAFRIRRAKTKLTGWAFNERVGFGVQLNYASSELLEDAYVDLDTTGSGALRLRLGQYKVPFGRQELTSSGYQQFVDRSITSNRYARGRDVGLMLHGAGAGGRVSWAAGLFNGSGPGSTTNPDGRYQFDARLQVAPNGDPGYSEPDLDFSPKPLYAFAVQVEHDDEGLGDDRRELTTWGADACFKFRGFALFGEFFSSRIEPTGAPRLESDGFAVQAGYVLPGPKVELAGRYARWEAGPGDDRIETGGALSWYPEGHLLKIQADLRFLDGGLGPDDTQLRFQTQIVF